MSIEDELTKAFIEEVYQRAGKEVGYWGIVDFYNQ